MPDFLHKRLSGRLVVQKILANSGWLLADQILRIGLGAIISIWVARYLGPERFGAYSYALALAALVAPLSAFGLDALVVRDLVHAPENSRRILASVVVLRLCTGTASIIGAILLAVVLRPGDSETQILVLIVSSAALFQAISALDFWFQSKLQSKFTVIARDLAFLAAAGTKIWCVLNEAPIEIFGMAVLVEAVVSALSLWSMFRRVSGNNLDLRLADWMTIRKYIFEARSLVLTGLLIAVYMRVDRVILGAVLDNRAVGLYSVAVQLCEFFYILPTVLLSSLYPVFVELYRRDEQLYTRRLIQIMRAFFYIGLVIAILFFVCADKVVVGMFGSKFFDAVQITKVYIFVLPLVSMSIIFSHRYVLNGTTNLSLIGVVVGSISSGVLNYLIVPIYGSMGAAYVALLAQVIPTLAVTVLVDRNVGIIFFKAMMPRWRD
jgi:PST family polysaccharide transporter